MGVSLSGWASGYAVFLIFFNINLNPLYITIGIAKTRLKKSSIASSESTLFSDFLRVEVFSLLSRPLDLSPISTVYIWNTPFLFIRLNLTTHLHAQEYANIWLSTYQKPHVTANTL